MGFSVSGAFAVIVIASFMALGMIYSSAAVGFELVREAQQDAHDAQLAEQNTKIEISHANWSLTGGCGAELCLVVEATNNGTTALTLNSTDLLVDGLYVDRNDYSAEEVGDGSATQLWLPGETYHIEVSKSALEDVFGTLETFPPDRAKLVTEHGRSDSRHVEDDTVG